MNFLNAKRHLFLKDRPNYAKKLRFSRSQSKKIPSLPLEQVPVIRCPCGKGPCTIFTSHSEKNPGRNFYTCYQSGSVRKCRFFRWVDEVLEFKVPECPCGAGACSLNRDENGRWFLACRIKKGHGACSFFQWAELRTNSGMNMHFHDRISCASPECGGFSTLNFKDDEEAFCEIVDEVLESSKHEVLSTSRSMEDEAPNRDSDSVIQKILSSNGQVLGTLSSEEAQVPKKMLETNGIQQPTTPSKDAQLPRGVSRCHSRCQNRNTRQNDSASLSVFKHIGQGLLKTLEDKNLLDREKMFKIAVSVFETFHHLSISNLSFSGHVMKYIEYKSKLAAVEGSISEGLTSQQLEGIFKCEATLSNVQLLHGESSRTKKRKLFRNLDQELEQSETKSKVHPEMSARQTSKEAAWEEMKEAFADEIERKLLQDGARIALEMARAELPS